MGVNADDIRTHYPDLVHPQGVDMRLAIVSPYVQTALLTELAKFPQITVIQYTDADVFIRLMPKHDLYLVDSNIPGWLEKVERLLKKHAIVQVIVFSDSEDVLVTAREHALGFAVLTEMDGAKKLLVEISRMLSVELHGP